MPFTIKQNDTSPAFQASLKDANGASVNLTGATVAFRMLASDNTLKVNYQMSVTDASAGSVTYNWQSGDTNTVGNYTCDIKVTYSDGSLETFPNNEYLTVTVIKGLV